MNTKDKVLKALEENREEYVSGEALASLLDISRNGIWKAIQALKEEGYLIEGVTNKGYMLKQETDIISSSGIKKYLTKDKDLFRIEIFDELKSTNDYLKTGDYGEGTVVIAKRQLEGKGRLGRSFYSPSDTGLYLSVLLKPDMEVSEATLITALASVCVLETIEELTGEEAAIKWVNDIFFKGKKVSGILTEASMDLENNRLRYVVLGVGVNLTCPKGGFPKDVCETGGWIFDNENRPNDLKNRFTAILLKKIFYYYNRLSLKEYMNKYSEKSMVIGEMVSIYKAGELTGTGKALRIDDKAGLVVLRDNGREEILRSGEVSVRRMEGLGE